MTPKRYWKQVSVTWPAVCGFADYRLVVGRAVRHDTGLSVASPPLVTSGKAIYESMNREADRLRFTILQQASDDFKELFR